MIEFIVSISVFAAVILVAVALCGIFGGAVQELGWALRRKVEIWTGSRTR